MYTLDTFYRSKEWEAFRKQLLLQREEEDGQIVCGLCGKPILKKYDCIGHHKIKLTEENVNDYTVSLNPDNVELIHFKCHNKIHERYSGISQEVFLVYGPPCAGKTTWVNEVANDDDLILDIDKLWEAICKADRLHKPNRLRRNVFGIRDCIIDQIRTRTGMWRNAYVIGGYPLRTDRDRLCEMLKATPVYIEATREECLDRSPNGNWTDYILDWFDSFMP